MTGNLTMTTCPRGFEPRWRLEPKGYGANTRTLKSMVVPTTGRSPTLAHIGGFSTVSSISSSHRKPSFWCNRAKGSFHTRLGSSMNMQKGKRKYHAGTPHPNDRGGFSQWFGACSLMSTLMSGFQPAGRRWLLRGFLVGLPLCGSPPTHRRVGPPQGLPRHLPEHILGRKAKNRCKTRHH